jgi:hypothetical protein
MLYPLLYSLTHVTSNLKRERTKELLARTRHEVSTKRSTIDLGLIQGGSHYEDQVNGRHRQAEGQAGLVRNRVKRG